MPNQPQKRETVSVQELTLSNAYQLEAMINVLERKGLLTKAELLEKLRTRQPNGAAAVSTGWRF